MKLDVAPGPPWGRTAADCRYCDRKSDFNWAALDSSGCQPLLKRTLSQANRELQPFFRLRLLRWSKFPRCQACMLDLMQDLLSRELQRTESRHGNVEFYTCTLSNRNMKIAGVPCHFPYPCRVWGRKITGTPENARKHVKTGYPRSFSGVRTFSGIKNDCYIKHFQLTQNPPTFLQGPWVLLRPGILSSRLVGIRPAGRDGHPGCASCMLRICQSVFCLALLQGMVALNPLRS